MGGLHGCGRSGIMLGNELQVVTWVPTNTDLIHLYVYDSIFGKLTPWLQVLFVWLMQSSSLQATDTMQMMRCCIVKWLGHFFFSALLFISDSMVDKEIHGDCCIMGMPWVGSRHSHFIYD